MAWEGKVSQTRLEAYVCAYAQSHEHGGVSAHISRALGYIPYPTAARIVHQRTGGVKAQWNAGMFQAW
jgi:hypothetical protein